MGRPDVWEPVGFVDGHGLPVRVGARVTVHGRLGTVTELTDPDGDVRDGYPVAIAPTALVRYDNGAEERWGFEEGVDGRYRCSEADVLLASGLYERLARVAVAVEREWAR